MNCVRGQEGKPDLCGSAWIGKLVNMIEFLNEVSKFINAIIQD